MINDHPLIRDILKQPRILQREIENEIGESSEQVTRTANSFYRNILKYKKNSDSS